MKNFVSILISFVLLISVSCFANSPPKDFQSDVDGVEQIDVFNHIISADVAVTSDVVLEFNYEFCSCSEIDLNYSVSKNVENYVEKFSYYEIVENLFTFRYNNDLEVHLIYSLNDDIHSNKHNSNLKTLTLDKYGTNYFNVKLE
jgi:hypothetical protein